MKITLTTLATGLVLAASTLPAAAQSYDHLRCFRVKDSVASFAAITNLTPRDSTNFPVASGCTLKARSRELCIPVDKDRTDQGPSLEVSGSDLTSAFLCYTAKCRGEALPDSLLMSDQFGSHPLSGFHTSRLCAPAILGFPPSPPPRACTSATVPACDGTCGDQNFACAPDTGGTVCICKNVDIFAVCGLIEGPPNCLGTCDGQSSCVDGGGGACQCSLVSQ